MNKFYLLFCLTMNEFQDEMLNMNIALDSLTFLKYARKKSFYNEGSSQKYEFSKVVIINTQN